MSAKVKQFEGMSTSGQVEFLKNGKFSQWQREEKIVFLKAILKNELSSKTVASALKLLRELRYRDKYFFRRFMYHIDSSVSNAARKAVNQKLECGDSECARLKRVFREGDTEDRVMIARYFLEGDGKLNVDTLLSLLSFNNLRLREIIVSNISLAHELDEARLSDTLKNGSRVAWYVRAALVEILGNRRSKCLLDIVDHLLNDSNVEVKLKLLNALVRLEEERARVYIERLADDAILWVRKEARRALRTM
ncbi:MAG: HEAT repeat domain-containing protein [bacterium]|nr:HEAT repeat domain-containing protein [bacterium]